MKETYKYPRQVNNVQPCAIRGETPDGLPLLDVCPKVFPLSLFLIPYIFQEHTIGKKTNIC